MVPRLSGLSFALVACTLPGAATAQILETETARTIGRGVFEASTNFEYQTSSEGTEAALPLAAEYGFSNRFELLVEPVAYTSIRPNAGPQASGVGDIEVTLTYLASRETAKMPAFALAGEVKLPTAQDSLIGTKKTDYAGYLIASRLLGKFDVHANVGYTIVGKPTGAQLKNVWNFALASEMRLGETSELFAEILGNTASSSVSESTTPGPPESATPEAPSGEIVGSLGIAKYLARTFRVSAGISVDNNGAVLIRPGFTLRTR